MNLIFLDSTETRQIFLAGTSQAKHLRDVLKVSPGSTFWCGVKNACRGIATVEGVDVDGNVSFSVAWEKLEPPQLPPVCLLVGLSRPQTMKKIFALASEIGCASILVFQTERGDPSYAQSSIWRENDDELHEILQKSAEQTCTTLLPEIRLFKSLEDALNEKLLGEKILLDVYAQDAFPQVLRKISPLALTLAIGSERGWTDAERKIFYGNGFVSAHIGERVLRVENAVAVGLSVCLANLNCWNPHKSISV